MGPTRRAVRRMRWVLEDRRLTEEQRRGVLGPARRQWRPSIDDHRRYWSAYDWSRLGEEWTASPEWKHGLIEDVPRQVDTRRQGLSSGSDLLGVEDGSIEAVWSFDVFVHVAPGDQAAYLGEIARVLVCSTGGRARAAGRMQV
jgi:hypothetical protein